MKPIVVNGMFRSGTSILAKILASDPKVENLYYEPFHPDFPRLKRVVNKPKYELIGENEGNVMRNWIPDFHYHNLYLGEAQEYPEMFDFLNDVLVEDRVVKFVRLNLRLPWFRKEFSNVPIVHIIRDPRGVIFSHAGKEPSQVDHPNPEYWEKSLYYCKEYWMLYNEMQHFKFFFEKFEEDLPFVKLMTMWHINTAKILADSLVNDNSHLIFYEDLIEKPMETITGVYKFLKRSMPKEVEDILRGEKGESLGPFADNWNNKFSSKWIYDWNQVPNSVWEKALEKFTPPEPIKSYLEKNTRRSEKWQ